jgi:simple sugar transport system ATP-binding protein
VLVISQDLDELAEIADRIAVMFHGRLSAPLEAAQASREKLGLLMGGAKAGDVVSAPQEVSDAAGA